MTAFRTSRRRFLAGTGMVAGATLAAPFVRGAHAAGKLNVGFWDHFVPSANPVLVRLCKEWAEQEKVDLQVDLITTIGGKLSLTAAAERQGRTGHDLLSFNGWQLAAYYDSLEPVDDVVHDLIQRNGPIDAAVSNLAQSDGHWRAVPFTPGSQILPPCGRIDMLKSHAGLDVTQIFPAGAAADKALVDGWTWDAFLAAAEKCHKAGFPFGLPLGTTGDSTNWIGALCNAFGAVAVDAKGDIAIRSDGTRQVLEYVKRLAAFLPPDVVAWDDASNNRWLISGKGALILNGPSAWAVAKRDAPTVAEQCWTFAMPKGPKGRFVSFTPFLAGIWQFSKNKSAAKSLLAHLSTREAIQQLVAASQGFDLPPFVKFNDFDTWAEQAPPKGTIYNYPSRGDQVQVITASPAPPPIAAQIYAQATMPRMIARYVKGGSSMDQAITWAEGELEGYSRS